MTQRSDAVKNRELLLGAALSMLAEDGMVSMRAIAKEAGVSIGTLYRHFPTREALVLATYRNEVDQLHAAADSLLSALPPAIAFRTWMTRLTQYTIAKHGLADALRTSTGSEKPLYDETYARMVATIDRFLQANVAAGSIRPGLDPEIVLLAMAGLWQLDGASDWSRKSSELIELFWTGLGSHHDSSTLGAGGR